MSDFHGTCGTCVLWRPSASTMHRCGCFLVWRYADEKCKSITRRTDFIKSLVTGPEFVPEEVQKQIATTWTPRDPGWQIEADGLSVTMTNTDEHGGPHEDADDL